MKHVLLLVPIVLLAGCAGLGDAQAKLDDARRELDAAKEDAQQARDRYERVRSATLVREETLSITVQPVLTGTSLGFTLVSARRADLTLVAPANVTRLPLLGLADERGASIVCDPLTCSVALDENATVVATWMDRPTEKTALTRASLPPLRLESARVLATTAVSDVSS